MSALLCPYNQAEDRDHSLESLEPSYSGQHVSLIREELIALTGNHAKAIVLNQLLYWTQRVRDFELFLEEERSGASIQGQGLGPEPIREPQHGWIYKTANDLVHETLLSISRTTMRRHLSSLIQEGWIDERAHPTNKWDKTTQYRANIRKIQSALLSIRKSLPAAFLKAFPQRMNLSKTAEISKGHFAPSNGQNVLSKGQNALSYPYTEIITETINREHTTRTREDKNLESQSEDEFGKVELPCSHSSASAPNSASKVMVDLWAQHVGQDIRLTEKRKKQLIVTLQQTFQGDLNAWKQFCERIKASSFLMGQGSRKWRVSLDWILTDDNILKVLEGNFDNPEENDHGKIESLQAHREKAIHEVLDSISDPLWKKWCMELSSFQSLGGGGFVKELISLFELKGIAGAWFEEVEGRLIWIASEDKNTLDRIETLQFKILHVAQRDYPQATCIRTRLHQRSAQLSTQNLTKTARTGETLC